MILDHQGGFVTVDWGMYTLAHVYFLECFVLIYTPEMQHI